MFAIKAKKREAGIKLKNLRKEGEIPAVFYGAGQETTSISVPLVEFKKIWRDAGESSAVKISLGTSNIDSLIHEVQVDSVTGEPIHVDFLAIDMKKKIHVQVPLVFEGVSNAVKSGIGNLVKVLHEVEIDIKLGAGVTIINNPTEVVASIIEQVEEKEEVVAPVDLSAIEVEKKGKKEEEGVEETEATSTTLAKEEKPKTEKK